MYVQYLCNNREDLRMPTLLEVCLAPELRALLENDVNCVGIDESRNKIVQEGLPIIEAFVKQWKQDMEEELLAVVKSSEAYKKSSQNITKDVLSLATTVFLCTKCQKAVAHPDVFFHRCMRGQMKLADLPAYTKSETKDTPAPDEKQPAENTRQKGRGKGKGKQNVQQKETDYKLSVENQPGGLIWHALVSKTAMWLRPSNVQNPSPIVFHDAGFYHMKAMLDVLNLPHTTTLDEVVELDPYIRGNCTCFVGEIGAQEHWFMHWKKIVRIGHFPLPISNADC